MLGVRLSEDAEARLARHAREVGRSKSGLARDWILDGMRRAEVDELIRRAASLHAADRDVITNEAARDATNAQLRLLDSEDGGYDWGPDGPPSLL